MSARSKNSLLLISTLCYINNSEFIWRVLYYCNVGAIQAVVDSLLHCKYLTNSLMILPFLFVVSNKVCKCYSSKPMGAAAHDLVGGLILAR